jgi:hypothetical protein
MTQGTELMTTAANAFSDAKPAKMKSFWEQPGGKAGTILGLALTGAAIWGAYLLLPIIVSILKNLTLTIIFGAILAGLVYVIRDKKIHAIVWNLYKMICRRTAQAVIEYDPVAIARNYIANLKERRTVVVSQIGSLKGSIKSVNTAMETAEDERKASLGVIVQAREVVEGGEARGSLTPDAAKQAAVLAARKAGRRESVVKTYTRVKEKLEILYRVLNRILQAIDFTIEDMTDEVDVQERTRAGVLAGYSAVQAAKEIINGDPDKLEMYDMAMQFMIDDAAEKTGEIEAFLQMSEGFLSSIDLQNMAFEEGALAQLEAWEQRMDTVLLPPPEKQLLLAAARDPNQVLVPSSTSGVDMAAIPESLRGARPENPYRRLFNLGNGK